MSVTDGRGARSLPALRRRARGAPTSARPSRPASGPTYRPLRRGEADARPFFFLRITAMASLLTPGDAQQLVGMFLLGGGCGPCSAAFGSGGRLRVGETSGRSTVSLRTIEVDARERIDRAFVLCVLRWWFSSRGVSLPLRPQPERLSRCCAGGKLPRRLLPRLAQLRHGADARARDARAINGGGLLRWESGMFRIAPLFRGMDIGRDGRGVGEVVEPLRVRRAPSRPGRGAHS